MGDELEDFTQFLKQRELPGPEFEVTHIAAGNGIAYWVGVHIVEHPLAGDPDVPTRLQVGEIFHRDSDSWRLIHRLSPPKTAT